MTTPHTSPSIGSGADLPIHLTRFIGRDRELADLARLVASTRLVTLTGAGGSGKTRLAREVAARTRDVFARVWWADLAPLCEAELLPMELAAALHVGERATASPVRAIADAIGDEPTLLVLDNCEHLVDACAALAESLLRACPRLTVLATSREALGVASETAWLVPPLAGHEAAQLFIERATAASPAFAPTEANAGAIVEICRRLDGIPLAIELAAARVRVLSPEQIAARLDDAFRLLSSGSRTALPRHRTLRATMEWSYGLLGAREQVLLRRLAIFAGGFTLDAAEAVCAGDPLDVEDILDGVSALVDKSLVHMDAAEGEARYRLLETVRQYGLERLTEAGERDAVAARHAAHFLALVESIAPLLVGGAMRPGLVEQLAAEHDDIRAATAWATADAAHTELALRFVGALYWYWYHKGQFREARQLCDRALALDGDASPHARGMALLSSALTALAQGEYPLACAHFSAAHPLLLSAGDIVAAGACQAKHGAALLLGGNVDEAIRVLDETIEFTRDQPPPDIAYIFARFWRGWAAYVRGDLDLSHELTADNAAIGRRFGLATTLAHSLVTLARIELARGHIEEACALASEGIELEAENGDGWGMALGFEAVAMTAATRGRPEDAARLVGATQAHRERLAVALPGLAPAERDRLLAGLRDQLGSRFDTIVAEGRSISTGDTLRLALAEAARHTTEFRVPAPLVSPSPVAVPPRLRVRALGPLEVLVDGKLVDAAAWGSARPRELLAYLLVHPEGRTKEQVGLAFWPEASAAQLRNNFHVTLHRLRKALGAPTFVSLVNDRYRVDPALVEELDAAEFEREVLDARRALARQEPRAVELLERALARYRGDFLDGEAAGDWHLELRDRLQRLYVDALVTLGARLGDEERFGKAADVYRRLLARDELHEDAVVALMRCHVALGERSQALRVYRRYAEALMRELDAEPGAEASRLAEQLQQGAPALPEAARGERTVRG